MAYCTSSYPEAWDIYGRMADAVFARSYRLGWGNNVARFIEEEEKYMDLARRSGQPRPFLYIPDPHKRSGRYWQPEEFDLLTWMALVKGCKGFRYHHWHRNTFRNQPSLLTAVKKLNHETHDRQDMLMPLALVSQRVLDHKETGGSPAGWVKLYTAWSGDRGILLMVRNMNYKCSVKTGEKPFQVIPQMGLTIPVKLPDWFVYRGVKDLRSGARVSISIRVKPQISNIS